MKLEPFDIERAKAGEQVYTRNGEKAEIIKYIYDFPPDQWVAAIVINSVGNKILSTYPVCGKYYPHVFLPHSLDLMLKAI